MESENPIFRLMIFGKLKKMVNSYKHNKLRSIDKRVVKGLFNRHLKDFDEDEKERLANRTLF
jgi:hypothetical protein